RSIMSWCSRRRAKIIDPVLHRASQIWPRHPRFFLRSANALSMPRLTQWQGSANCARIESGCGDGVGTMLVCRSSTTDPMATFEVKRSFPKRLPGTVVSLGLVSMFMDVSSEMIHSILPLFLTTVLGVSTLSVGVIEGVA